MKYLILFLILFDPQIPYFINGVGFSALVLPLLITAHFIKSKDFTIKSEIIVAVKPFIYFFFAIILFALIRIFIAGENFEYLFGILKSVTIFSSATLYFIYYKQEIDTGFIQKLLALYAVNAGINFIAGTFPEHFGALELLRGKEINSALGFNPYRNSFISGSGYYSIGTAYGLFFLFYVFTTANRKVNLLSNASLLLVAIAGFVSARTSLFGIAAGLSYLIMRFQLRRIFAIFAIGLIFLHIALDDEIGFLGPYKLWLISFFDGGEDASADHLLNEMFFWPGEKVFFLGSGFTNSNTFAYTDSGFMQDILFGGIFFMLLKFAFPIYFFIKFLKKETFFVFATLLAIIAFQLKGAFFISNAQGMAIFYIIYFHLSQKYTNTNNPHKICRA